MEATSTLGSRILDPVDRHLGDPIAPPLRRQEKLRVEEPLITSEHGPTMQVVLWSVVHTPGGGRKVPLGFAFTFGRASQVQVPPLHHHATTGVASLTGGFFSSLED